MKTTTTPDVHQPVNETTTQPKKPYHAPRLQDHGAVQELALNTASTSGSDGGANPNIYS